MPAFLGWILGPACTEACCHIGTYHALYGYHVYNFEKVDCVSDQCLVELFCSTPATDLVERLARCWIPPPPSKFAGLVDPVLVFSLTLSDACSIQDP